jgi:hypothetical protein
MTLSGHTAREIAAWVAGRLCLIQPVRLGNMIRLLTCVFPLQRGVMRQAQSSNRAPRVQRACLRLLGNRRERWTAAPGPAHQGAARRLAGRDHVRAPRRKSTRSGWRSGAFRLPAARSFRWRHATGGWPPSRRHPQPTASRGAQRRALADPVGRPAQRPGDTETPLAGPPG